MENIIKKQLTGMSIADNEALEQIKFEEINITYTVDKEKFLPISTVNSFTLVSAEKNTKTFLMMDTKFSNINNVKEPELPKEAENAQEIKM